MEKIADDAYFYFLPFLLLFGGSILIATTFATIRLYDAFPKPYYYGLPFLSVAVLVVILALFSAASSVYDESCRVMGKMRPVVKRKGYFAKRLKAQKPFRFAFGSLFIAMKSTKMTLCGACLIGSWSAYYLISS